MNQANKEWMSHEQYDDVSDMEEEAKFKIITLEDEEETKDSQAKRIIADCQAGIAQLYRTFREWLAENQNSDEVKARKEKLKMESDKLIRAAKDQLKKLQENEDLKRVVNKGVQMAADTGAWVMDTVSEGIHDLKESESGKKIGAMVQNVKQDERVKQGVSSIKRGTLKLAESALAGLKKVLDEQTEGEVSKDEADHDL